MYVICPSAALWLTLAVISSLGQIQMLVGSYLRTWFCICCNKSVNFVIIDWLEQPELLRKSQQVVLDWSRGNIKCAFQTQRCRCLTLTSQDKRSYKNPTWQTGSCTEEKFEKVARGLSAVLLQQNDDGLYQRNRYIWGCQSSAEYSLSPAHPHKIHDGIDFLTKNKHENNMKNWIKCECFVTNSWVHL